MVLSMGFEREVAVQALARSRNDVAIAVELLSSFDDCKSTLFYYHSLF